MPEGSSQATPTKRAGRSTSARPPRKNLLSSLHVYNEKPTNTATSQSRQHLYLRAGSIGDRPRHTELQIARSRHHEALAEAVFVLDRSACVGRRAVGCETDQCRGSAVSLDYGV